VSQVPALLQRLEDGNEFDVVRCKNRFDPEYDTQASGGYRDYQLVLRTRIGSESLVGTTSPGSSKLKIRRWSTLVQAASPSASKLKPISCQWLYEVQIMTKGFHALKMGTGLVDSNELAAHEAYKNFRKFQELCERLSTHSKEMKAELEFGTMDDAVIDKRRGKSFLSWLSPPFSVTNVWPKRKGNNNNNKIGPTDASRPPLPGAADASRPPLPGAVLVLEEGADTLV